MHFKIDNLKIGGFSANIAKPGETVNVICRASLTSDDPLFFTYIDGLSNLIFQSQHISIGSVYEFLLLAHDDSTADVYVNDFPCCLRIRTKCNISAGAPVFNSQIADIVGISFPDITIKDDDKIAFCFKVDWKFGLFFDFTGDPSFSVEQNQIAIAAIYRHLAFQHVYESIRSLPLYDKIRNDGWFPFIEIASKEYKTLVKAYEGKADIESILLTLGSSFDKTRLDAISSKWWSNKIFNDKKPILSAGVNAYLQSTNDGYITCIKTLISEIEGILRIQYFSESGKGNHVKLTKLLEYLTSKASLNSISSHSLLLPTHFLKYLTDVVFRDFDLEAGSLNLSRHSSCHGVAGPTEYTQCRALQLILVLDQLFYYV